MLKSLFAFVTIAHGLIHLLGFVKSYKLADVSQLSQEISKPAGLLWLLTSLLFIAAMSIYLFNRNWWWMIAAAALVLSQVLIVMFWQDARFGTIANIIILMVVVAGYGTWSFETMVGRELRTFLPGRNGAKEIVTRERISHLPPVVQRWLERSNIIGKEVIQTVHLQQQGMMRTSSDAKWMPFEATQWFRTGQPGFFWTADVVMAPGINFVARDKYENGRGKMLIKALALFPIADAQGKEIDQGAMLRYLAEIVWFPSAALDGYITWQQVDSVTAKATITNGEIEASGIFAFNAEGDVMSFRAKRYYDRKEGATLEDWFIQNEPDGYKKFEGIRVPAKSTVTWKLKTGDHTWLKLEIMNVDYNSAAVD
jgi:hypothetical protein